MIMLLRYMTGMLGSTDFTWHWHTGAAPWEEKVAELLPFISSVEARLVHNTYLSGQSILIV